ncbi:hypothetical protein AJ87_30265 [Rhizobium yanglingense]|nr:hypothetical protein AJ87_30265 [Rhizobium yanglingense]
MVAPGDFRAALAQTSAGYAVAAVDQLRQGDLRRAMHQQVNMIVLAVAFDQFGLEVATQLGEDAPPVADCRF